MAAGGGNVPPPTTPPPLGGNQVAVPTTIDASGKTDTSAAWNDWLGSLPDGRDIVFPIDGTYRLDRPVTVTGKKNWTFTGRKSRFVQGPEPVGLTTQQLRSRYMLRFAQTDGVVVRDLQFIGSNLGATWQGKGYDSTREAQHAVDLQAAKNTTIAGCLLGLTWGDAIYLGPSIGPGFPPCENTRIQSCSIYGTGRQSIAVCAAKNTTIEWCGFDLARRTVIDVEPNSADWHVDGITIRDSVFGYWRLGMIGLNGHGTISNVRVERVTATRRLAVLASRAADRARVRNVEVLDCVGPPGGNDRKVGMKRVDGLLVVGNRAPHIARTTDPTGCVIGETCDVDIHDNDWGPGLPQFHNQTPDYVCA